MTCAAPSCTTCATAGARQRRSRSDATTSPATERGVSPTTGRRIGFRSPWTPRDDALDVAGRAAVGDIRPSGHRRKRSGSGSFWRELPVLILIALALALLLKTFLVQAFYIPSGSMENTLQVGDRVLVNRMVYRLGDIERGDVIVFNGVDSWTPEVQIDEPSNPVAKAVSAIAGAFGFATPNEKDFIKRVIGIPGDRVKCCDKEGRIHVNGVPLDETYVYPGDKPSEQQFDVVVPEGRVWVMGDHRGASSDSRYHLGDPGADASRSTTWWARPSSWCGRSATSPHCRPRTPSASLV